MKPARCILFLLTFSIPCLAGDEALQSAIKSRHDNYLKSLKAGDAEGVAAQYTKDAVLLRPRLDLLKGVDSILRVKKEELARVNVTSGAIQTTELESSGNLAYEIGYFSFTFRLDDGEPTTIGGKFLNVWKKQADGSWLCKAEADLPD